jgi:hypothetical protein
VPVTQNFYYNSRRTTLASAWDDGLIALLRWEFRRATPRIPGVQSGRARALLTS